MNHISLARVDDRLIHGQVMTNWLQYTGAKQIIIIDDEVDADPFLNRVIKMAAPKSVNVQIFDQAKAVSFLLEELSSPTILLAKSPAVYLYLVQQGIPLTKITIGGMGANKSRKTLYKNISANGEERQMMKALINLGVTVTIQIISSDKAITVTDKLLTER